MTDTSVPIEHHHHHSTCASPSSHTLPPYGIICDIDGVLIKDGQPIPFARQAVESWQKNHRARLLFVTNSSGVREHDKAIKTNEQLQFSDGCGFEILKEQMIVAQTPMKMLLNTASWPLCSSVSSKFSPLNPKDRILFVARDEDAMERLLIHDYGFENVVRFSKFASEHAYLLPYTHSKHENFLACQETEHEEPIRAIFVLDYPMCWDDTLQVLVDLLLSDGRVGHLVDEQVVQLYIANPDFVYAGNYKLPRFTQGAFRDCLSMLYSKMTRDGRPLQYVEFGKPFKSTYQFAKQYLRTYHGRCHTAHDGNKHEEEHECRTIYAIGDNPHSDICGANASGDEFFSILVRTGVFKGENSEEHPAKFVCDSIAEAFAFIEQRESSHY